MRPKLIGASLLRRPEMSLLIAVVLVRILLLFVGYVSVVAQSHPPDAEVPIGRTDVRQELDNFRYADVEWYAGIVEHGYEDREFTDDRKANWAFFPLWPLIWRGIWELPPNRILNALVVNTALFGLGVVALYHLLRLDVDERTAYRASLLAVLFPGAYFALRPGPEAAAFATAVGAFYAARRSWWALAGVMAALAALARPQGILLLPCLAWVYVRQVRATDRHRASALSLLLAPAALAGFMLYLDHLTGNPLASLDIQKAWDNSLEVPFAGVGSFLAHPKVIGYYGFDLAILSAPVIVATTVLTIVMFRVRTIPREYVLFTTLSLVLIVSKGNTAGPLRYLIPVFPVYLVIALLARDRPPWLNVVGLGFLGLQVFAFSAFIQHVNWATT